MKALSAQDIAYCIEQSAAKKSLMEKLRPSLVAASMENQDWSILELLQIPTRDEKGGVLIIESRNRLYATPYELSRGVGNKSTGQLKPVICDLCKTWQAGPRAGTVTFRKDKRSLNSTTLLCCADLNCSLHVRSRTTASKISRSQLREDINDEARVQRLQDNLEALVKRFELTPLTISH